MIENKSKSVNIYGTGEVAGTFFLCDAWKNNINVVIDGDIERIKRKKIFFGYKIKYISDALLDMRNYYTLIAVAQKNYWEIKHRLESEFGLHEFEDFEYYGTYKKKKVFIYGNCHMDPIKNGLCYSRDFMSRHGIFPFPQIQEMKDEYWDDYVKSLEYCDIFIYQPIREGNSFGKKYSSKEFLGKLSLQCRKIAIPNTYSMPRFLYPQIYKYSEGKKNDGFKNSFFPYRDKYIDSYKNERIDDILSIIEDEQLIEKAEILENRDIFFDKLREREREWDFGLCEFIEKSLEEKKLFYEPNHPAEAINFYVFEQLKKMLCINDMERFSCVAMDDIELPIYSCVAKALNLKYSTRYIRQCNGRKLYPCVMTKKEYIRQYLLWHRDYSLLSE